MKEIQAALWQGANAPEELRDYLLARRLWRDLGVRLDPEENLDRWSEEKIRRYTIVMDYVGRWEQAQQEAMARRHAQQH